MTPADLVSGGSPLPGSQVAVFSLCPHTVESTREFSGVSSIRALIPFMRAPPLGPNCLSKDPPPNIITLGIRFQRMNLEGMQIFSLQQGVRK